MTREHALDLMTAERTDAGVRRLLAAPRDLLPCGVRPCPPPTGSTGVVAHRTLFREYAGLVEIVTAEALDWWGETLATRCAGAPDREQAERECWRSRPAGPASFPGLVALVREYWLACDRLNSTLTEPQRVAPETFLLDWLLAGSQRDTVRVLACMPYWPVGLDEVGEWV